MSRSPPDAQVSPQLSQPPGAGSQQQRDARTEASESASPQQQSARASADAAITRAIDKLNQRRTTPEIDTGFPRPVNSKLWRQATRRADPADSEDLADLADLAEPARLRTHGARLWAECPEHSANSRAECAGHC